MTRRENYETVNSQCARVCQLIFEAERTSDPTHAVILYRAARSLAADISRELKECLNDLEMDRTAAMENAA